MRKGLADILRKVCKSHLVTLDDLQARRRAPHLIAARVDFIVQAKNAGYSYPVIGRAIKRHHATAIYHYHAATNAT